MDLEEWELVAEEGFLEIHDDGGKKIYSRKGPRDSQPSAVVFHTNYFICPSRSTPQQDQPMAGGPDRQVLPLSIHILEPAIPQMAAAREEPPSLEKTEALGCERDSVSKVFFKKMKKPEFVDIKVGSPRSNSGATGGFIPPIESGGAIQFQEKVERVASCEDLEVATNAVDLGLGEGGSSIWKWSLTGIGAICSFGVAFATVCGIISSGQHPQQSQKFHLQIFTDDKRMKSHRRKASEAISAVEGLPMNNARITFGGHYSEALHV